MVFKQYQVHMVGVGGSGMCGIAEVLLSLGHRVTGSDLKETATTQRLASLGAVIHFGHTASNVGSPDVVVISSAVAPDNPEVVAARAKKIPVIPRADMLAELMRLKYSVTIAGAHGKTSTTSMTGMLLQDAGLDPTIVIGGRLQALGSHARSGGGDFIVVEADESDRSFLKLSPSIAVITNIDHEHMESYGTWDNLQQAFADFANKVPFYGAVIACVDDVPVRELITRLTRRVITYGLDEGDVAGTDMQLQAFGSTCVIELRRPNGRRDTLGTMRLQVPGRHNVLNAVGAVAVSLEVGIPFAKIAEALAEFRGAERRFQTRGEVNGVLVIDDYGHHPTEIAAVLAAAKAGIDRRVIAVFQPHRYSRTQHLLGDFGPAFAAADVVVLTDIYAAGEAPIEGVTIEALADAVGATAGVPVHLVKSIDDLPAAVAALCQPGDLVLTLGAGSIGAVGDRILAELSK